MSVSPASPAATPPGDLRVELHQVGVEGPNFTFNWGADGTWETADKGYGLMIDPDGVVWRVTKDNFAGQHCIAGKEAQKDIEKIAREMWLKMRDDGILDTLGSIRIRGTEYITTDRKGNETIYRTQNRILPNGFLRAKEHLEPYILTLYERVSQRYEGDKFPDDPKEVNKAARKAIVDFQDDGWVAAEIQERKEREEAKEAAARDAAAASSPAHRGAGAPSSTRYRVDEPDEESKLPGTDPRQYPDAPPVPRAHTVLSSPLPTDDDMPDLMDAADLPAPRFEPPSRRNPRAQANAATREKARVARLRERELEAQPAQAPRAQPDRSYRRHKLGQAAAAPQGPVLHRPDASSSFRPQAAPFSHDRPNAAPRSAFIEEVGSDDDMPPVHEAWNTGGSGSFI